MKKQEASAGQAAAARPPGAKLNIAIVGPGRMGSMFAYHLVRAGHQVTLVGRAGARLEQLQRDGAVLTALGERAEVEVAKELDPSVAWDLVLAPVQSWQISQLLPALHASAAKAIMFMFTTYESLSSLRDAVGPHRFAFGFPKLPAVLDAAGRLQSTAISGHTPTIVSDAGWAAVFNAAGIPSQPHADMQAYVRSHAATFVPVLVMCTVVHERRGGLTWREARTHAAAQTEGYALTKRLGHKLVPWGHAVMGSTPQGVRGVLLWLFSRTIPADMLELLAGADGEARAQIDTMAALAPSRTAALQSIRP